MGIRVITEGYILAVAHSLAHAKACKQRLLKRRNHETWYGVAVATRWESVKCELFLNQAGELRRVSI
jgi:hypothetical protein